MCTGSRNNSVNISYICYFIVQSDTTRYYLELQDHTTQTAAAYAFTLVVSWRWMKLMGDVYYDNGMWHLQCSSWHPPSPTGTSFGGTWRRSSGEQWDRKTRALTKCRWSAKGGRWVMKKSRINSINVVVHLCWYHPWFLIIRYA
jgi:hypothetical protein